MAKGFNKLFQKQVKPELIYRKTPVVWGIPCDELGFSKFWIQFVGTAGLMPFDRFATAEGTYLQKARNDIHNKFLETQSQYLVMLDSDIIFPPKMLETLMAHNLPVVGGWYRDKKASDHHPVVYDFVKDEKDFSVFRHHKEVGQGLEKIDAIGMGCILMNRDTAEKLGQDPYGHKIAGGGEDFIMCRKLMELGIPLHVDWSLNCAHLGVGYY